MNMRTIGACFILAMGTLSVGCGGEKESSSEPAAVETSEASNKAMARAKGAVKFKATCAACHGEDAKGLPNLGRDLTISEFVKSKTDEELLAFVIEGRIPMGGNAAMPPRGGHTDLTDDQIRDIIVYLRSIME